MKDIVIRGLFGGIFISLGCMVYLSIGGIFGAILFAFGLMSICFLQLKLFTGVTYLCNQKRDYYNLLMILISNVLSCLIVGTICEYDTTIIIMRRLETSYLNIFINSCFTGIIMTTAVKIYRDYKNLFGVLFGVPLFIICGFPHCIADAFYYSSYGWNFNIFIVWLISVIGNFIGCSYTKVIEYKPK